MPRGTRSWKRQDAVSSTALRGAWSCPHCDIRFLASRTVKKTHFCYFRPSRRRRCAVAALGTQCTTPRLKWSSLGDLSRGHRCRSLEVHVVTPGEARGPSTGDRATYSSIHGNDRHSLTRHVGRWKTNLLCPRGKVSHDSDYFFKKEKKKNWFCCNVLFDFDNFFLNTEV